MGFLIQSKEKITAEDKEDTKKCKISPDILENKQKLKEPKEIQGMRRVDKLKIPIPSVLVDIVENIGVLSMIQCLDSTYEYLIILCIWRKYNKEIKTLVGCEREKCQTQYVVYNFPRILHYPEYSIFQDSYHFGKVSRGYLLQPMYEYFILLIILGQEALTNYLINGKPDLPNRKPANEEFFPYGVMLCRGT
jgi:hypothetical protein